MHQVKEHKFDTKEKAENFANLQRLNTYPGEDRYVRGPFFLDDDEIFKNIPGASQGRKYWIVTIETYR